MENPYKVLGVREGASKEEIKAAYREQVKKYHPDKYQENPLYELAEEKLQEINEAYDTLMNENGGAGSTFTKGSSQGKDPDLREVRRNIDMGNLARAEQLLNSKTKRGAEWHFLYGMMSLRKGWYDEAVTGIQTAVSMDPANPEYKSALNSLMQSSGGYRADAYGRGYNNNADEMCRMCQCCICLDCMTDCI